MAKSFTELEQLATPRIRRLAQKRSAEILRGMQNTTSRMPSDKGPTVKKKRNLQ